MLHLVAEPDEEAEVRLDRVLRVPPAFRSAAGKLPALRLAVDLLLKAAGIVPLPIAIVDVIPSGLGVEGVELGDVHVDEKARGSVVAIRLSIRFAVREGRTTHV